MKENSTGGINYSTIKKSLSIALVFFSIVAASLLGIICANSNIFIRQNNLPAVVDVNAVRGSEGSALSYYLRWRLFNDKNMELGGTKVTHIPEYATHAIRVPWLDRDTGYIVDRAFYILAEINDPNNALSLKDTYFEISNEKDYIRFVELTHEKSEKIVGWRPVNFIGQVKPLYISVNESYYVYPFMYSSGTASVNFIQIEDKWYLNMGTIYDRASENYSIIKGELKADAPKVEYEETYENFRLTVVLTNDITVTLNSGEIRKEKENIQYFAGIFDGQGHTINFNGSDKYYSTEAIGVKGFSEAYSPFCSYNDGIIKNVKLDYSKLNYLLIDDGWTAVSYAGGIVGNNHGTVDCCIVNSPRVYSQRFNSNAYFGALVGVNDGNCHNCAVTGEYYIRAHGWNIGHPDGINAYWGSASGKNKVSKSVFSASVVEEKDQAKNEDFIRSPADVGKTAGNNQLAYNSQNEASSYDVNNGGIRNPDSSYSGLASISSEGGSSDETGELWYFASDYDDIPHLRVFLTWKKIFFKSAKETIVKPTVDYIKVPKDAYKFGSKAGADIEIYGQTIKATIASGYYIAGWNWSESDLTYTVQYGQGTINLRFRALPSNVTVTPIYSFKPNTDYILLKNSIIEIDTKYYDNDTIKSITYKFTAIENNKLHTYTFIFRGYKPDSLLSSQTYHLKHHPDNKSTESFYATDDYVSELVENTIIINCPTAAKKRYGIEIK